MIKSLFFGGGEIILSLQNPHNFIKTSILKMNLFLLYIDPGSGSLLFQALLSGLFTALLFFKRIVAFFKFKFGKKKTENDQDLTN